MIWSLTDQTPHTQFSFQEERSMPTRRHLALQVLLLTCALLTCLPAVAQVPRAVFAELGSATW
jgi:hypothetical protein